MIELDRTEDPIRSNGILLWFHRTLILKFKTRYHISFVAINRVRAIHNVYISFSFISQADFEDCYNHHY